MNDRTSKTMLFPWRFARDESPPRNVPVLVAWRRGSGWQFDVAKFGGKCWLEVLPDAPNNEFFAPPHYWRTIDSPDDVCAAVPSDETSEGLPLRQEPKYTVHGGRIVNRSSGQPIPDDEPVFILRAKDREAIYALMDYRSRCLHNADHYQAVDARVADFLHFKEINPTRMQTPDTAPEKAVETSDTLDAARYRFIREQMTKTSPISYYSMPHSLMFLRGVIGQPAFDREVDARINGAAFESSEKARERLIVSAEEAKQPLAFRHWSKDENVPYAGCHCDTCVQHPAVSETGNHV